MFCKNCGKESNGNQKFCTSCGADFSTTANPDVEHQSQPSSSPVASVAHKINTSRIIQILVVVGLVGWGIYGSRDDSAIQKNNDALTSLDSGNSQQGITQLQQASNDASGTDTKISTLKNLAYAQWGENQDSQALETFQRALALAGANSFDYYLISGEIALLENKPNSAYLSFSKAVQISPDDFQINSTLTAFYLNLDGVTVDYENYPKALTYAQKAYNLNPSEDSRTNLGIAYYWNDKYDKSISLLSQSNLDQHPFVALWLGLDYAAKDDATNAKFYMRKAITGGVDVPQEIYDYLASN